MVEVVLNEAEARARLIPQSAYVSCPVAFIDCKKPGSHLKRNYSMIGPGVTTSTDQVVNLREPHGFNIGAAGMPHGIVNNLHIHFTAEVFMVLRGAWKFRWGPNGDDGEIVGEAGSVVSVPTWVFRGFTNVGPDDGWIFTTLGGDNTGGIIWHPEIVKEAAQYGMYLTKDNILVDTATGAAKPDDADLLQPITAAEIAALKRYSVDDMRGRIVTAEERDWSSAALLDSCLPGHASAMAPVIGSGISQYRHHQAKIINPHGFSMEWLRLPPGQSVSPFRVGAKQVLMGYKGKTAITLNRGANAVMLPMDAIDMLSVPGDVWRAITNAGTEDAEILVITAGEGRKTPHWAEDTVAAALAAGIAADASGLLAPAHLLPDYRIGRKMAEPT